MNARRIANSLSENHLIAGVLLVLGGYFMFALNDAMGKWLVASFSVAQVLFVRSVGAFFVLAPMIAKQGAEALLRPERPGLQVLRVLLATLETGLFYAAVTYLPLADVMTFYMAGPIFTAALSYFFLGERVGWRRWLAISIGFVGVVIALRPTSAAFSLPSLFALLGSLSFSVIIILTRTLRNTSDTTLVTWQTAGALIAGAVFSLVSWQSPSALELGALLLLGVVSCCAHLMVTRSLKLAPASLLAPLQYTLMLWAIVFGWAFFGDVPDRQILVGSGIIVLAGLFIFHRQKVVRKTISPSQVPLGPA